MTFLFALAWQALVLEAAPGGACLTCHRAETVSQATTPMALALQSGRDAEILREHPSLHFRSGKYSWSIRREGDRSIYSITDGSATIEAPIAWAFGSGSMGQTYLFERNGAWYEAAVSYFTAIHGLDWTLGHAARPRGNVEEAAGRRLSREEAQRCFGCHSTGAIWNNALDPESITPGVRCEQCHEGAAKHAEALHRGDTSKAAAANLSAMKSEDLSNLCGKCHPRWDEIAATGPRGPLNVRFQIYRLTNSLCYDSADARISCAACHDAHAHRAKEAAFYDARCQACHTRGKQPAGARNPKSCPVAKGECISCHMPKVEIPELHFRFTDHRIRIARAGERYPD
jgi:hypothetical protein